jgi:hypothetical protein
MAQPTPGAVLTSRSATARAEPGVGLHRSGCRASSGGITTPTGMRAPATALANCLTCRCAPRLRGRSAPVAYLLSRCRSGRRPSPGRRARRSLRPRSSSIRRDQNAGGLEPPTSTGWFGRPWIGPPLAAKAISQSNRSPSAQRNPGTTSSPSSPSPMATVAPARLRDGPWLPASLDR